MKRVTKLIREASQATILACANSLLLHLPDQVGLVTDALRDGVVSLIRDLNGNHVIQRCLQRLGPEDSQFVYDAAAAHTVDIATHRHGCCVLQRCIDFANGHAAAAARQRDFRRNALRAVAGTHPHSHSLGPQSKHLRSALCALRGYLGLVRPGNGTLAVSCMAEVSRYNTSIVIASQVDVTFCAGPLRQTTWSCHTDH